MMTSEETGRIVREVIRRLRSQPEPGAKPAVLKLADRVITLSSIEGQLNGVQQLIVPAKAVVTPAVRDELNTNKVQLIRQVANDPPDELQELRVANLGHKDISQILNELHCKVEEIQVKTLEESVLAMANQLSGARGVVVGDRPEFVVCLANRHPQLRAFVGHDGESVRRSRGFAGNLMAVDEASKSIARLLAAFVHQQ